MPRIKGYTPSWLSKGTPAHSLFEPTTETAKSLTLSSTYQSKKKSLNGPRRTIARRGTEIFVASGREVRWGDLAYMRDAYHNRDFEPQDGARGHRTLKIAVADDIRQLVISPNSNFLAILTSHTVHVCLIPDSSHLTAESHNPIKPTVFTLGPTIHVTSRAPIVSALWHPLGVNGSCLVTVTSDAVVRVWELSVTDRWSFDAPTLDIDLKKLADGQALDQDFKASTATVSTGFSPDSFEMEVASACFGARSSGGWSAFTLWVAMREGDVYALCPLLPQKWAPPPALIASLSVSVVANVAAVEDDPEVSDLSKLLAQQQLAWMGDIDNQEPVVIEPPPGEPVIEIYNRPARPGSVPRLQGPFTIHANLDSEDDIDLELTDIFVIGPRVDAEELMDTDADFDLDEIDTEGLSLSILGLLSTGGQVKICLDLDGVEAQWLPPRNKPGLARLLAAVEPPSLLLYQAMDSMNPVEASEGGWPVFSPDVMSRYSFYVTHHAGITYFSLTPWVFRLESEIQESGAGSEFRLGLLVNAQASIRERLWVQRSADASMPLAGCVAMSDPDVGYGAISATAYEPILLVFESPVDDYPLVKRETPELESDIDEVQPLYAYEPRPLFRPSHVFEQNSMLPAMIERLRTSRHRAIVGQEVRLSPLTLQVFTEVHKVLSDETHRLGLAASDLFIKCNRMRAELAEQLKMAAETKAKIDKIVGDGEDGLCDDERIDQRVAHAQERHERIAARMEALRKTASKAAKRDISAKERAWMDEIKDLESSILGGPSPDEKTDISAQRYATVRRIAAELLTEVSQLPKESGGEEGGAHDTNGGSHYVPGPVPSMADLRVPSEIRKTKLAQVKGLLERETAMIESVTARLERLQTGLPS